LARAAATQKEVDDLLEAEGDDQADADGDEVEKHVVGIEHAMWGHGIADGCMRGLWSGGVEGMEAGANAVGGALVGGGHALGIEGDRGGAHAPDVRPSDGVGKVRKIVGEAAEGVTKFDVLLECGLRELKDFVEALRRKMGGIGIYKLESSRVVDRVPAVEGLLGHATQLGVEVLIRGSFGEGQAAGDAIFSAAYHAA
jgi:hypothetical protein